jgi:RNA polymerase sigma factor (sigma-70 family)
VLEIPSDENPELEYIKSEERKMLYRELVKLSSLEREVISMKFFEEKTNRKIASELSMNESTVSSTVYNTIRKLRKGMAQYRDEEGAVAL